MLVDPQSPHSSMAGDTDEDWDWEEDPSDQRGDQGEHGGGIRDTPGDIEVAEQAGGVWAGEEGDI